MNKITAPASSMKLTIIFALVLAIVIPLLVSSAPNKNDGGKKFKKMTKKLMKQQRNTVEDTVKKRNLGWTVGENNFDNVFDDDTDLEVLFGGEDEQDENKKPKKQPHAQRKKPNRHDGSKPDRLRGLDTLPDSYDVRVYTNCPSISSVRYQYRCSSCWAVTAASVMSDRHCIYNSAKTGQLYVSTLQTLSCVDNGCTGGKEWNAFDYWVKNGIVTGGTAYAPANQTLGCAPYPYGISATPAGGCLASCTTPNYARTFDQDKTYGGDWYLWWSPNIADIKNEIYNYGPVTAFFSAYEDFLYYKEGIYQYAYGNLVGYHVTKLIGWGSENGTDYWLAANTWGVNWGEKGFFKIRMSKNEVGIESRITGVLPKEAFSYLN